MLILILLLHVTLVASDFTSRPSTSLLYVSHITRSGCLCACLNKSRFTVGNFLQAGSCSGNFLQIHDQYEYANYQFHGWKPRFDNIYTAKITDNNVEVVDGPIILQNCGVYVFGIRILTGNVTFSIRTTDTEFFGSERNCSIYTQFSINDLIKTHIKSHLYNVFKIQAVYDHYVVAESNIIAFNSPTGLIYDINGEKYLILGYSWYITLIIYVSLSILISFVLLFVTIIRRENVHRYFRVTNTVV